MELVSCGLTDRELWALLLFVDWLLNIPATCECISGTDLLNLTCCHTEKEVACPSLTWPALLSPTSTVPCRIVFARAELLVTWPYHFTFLLFMIVGRSMCGSIAWVILILTLLFVLCSY